MSGDLVVKLMIISRGYPTNRYRGNGIFEFDQAKALTKQGIDVILAAVDIRSIRRWRTWGFENKIIEGVKVYAINLPVGRVPNPVKRYLGYLALCLLYNRIVKTEGKPQVIHAHFPFQGYNAAKLKLREKLPLVVTEHSSSVMGAELNNEACRLAADAYENADRIVAVSPALQDVIFRKFQKNALYIPNMIDTKLFSFEIREKIEGLHFISVGHLKYGKRMDLLINAFATIATEYSDVWLDIIGSGPEKQRLEQLVKKHNLSSRVFLHGFQTRAYIADKMKESFCFVLPSQLETFGVVYAEAMACGLPVIATRCGGPEGFVTPDNGILIDVDNQCALETAMRDMLENRNKYDNGKISRFAWERFSPEVVAGKLIEMYGDVLADTAAHEKESHDN